MVQLEIPDLMGKIIFKKIEIKNNFNLKISLPGEKGWPGIDGKIGRDGEKGSKGSKGLPSEYTPFCKG